MQRADETFVHVFLFECSQCARPVPAVITSKNRNPEEVDATLVEAKCACGRSIKVVAAAARRHLVVSWSLPETGISTGT
jgi:hypothetical protein